MKRILLLAFCLLFFPVMASHIVGGEFELVHLSGYTYKFNLIVYFDEVNGAPGNKQQDQIITAKVFRVSDNAFMRYVVVRLKTDTPVSYTQPECSIGALRTSRMFYESDVITLSPQQYGDPKGYYIVWERCCRNYTISNIYSNDPQASSGIAAGQTFYLQFPPVMKDGLQFIDSSPRLFPPLSDYACPGKPYYADFAGTDDDGDSLAYSLVTPYSTHSTDAYPEILPAPFVTVTYIPPFSQSNILGGSPDLKISTDGFLTVTPRFQGLFVFAVKCEEFRDGIKIGEVRRDFQFFVTDCPVAVPPNIKGKRISDAAFTYDENMTVSFSSTAGDADRCIQVEVSDLDALDINQNLQEKISIKAIPLNFKKDISGVLPAITNATLTNGSTATFDICFDVCPPFENAPFQVGIIAFDDACALPLSDTLVVTVYQQPPANSKPYFTTPNVTALVNEGETIVWPIRGVDDDGDPLIPGVVLDGFSLADVGMKLTQTRLQNGLYEASLEWDPKCDVYDFTKRTHFEITILLEDQDQCNFTHRAAMLFKLDIRLPGNAGPVIATDLPPEQQQNGVTKKVMETLEFNVLGADEDKDFLVLSGTGIGFNMADYNISFPQITGNAFLSQHFKWELACDKIDLAARSDFDFRFIVMDNANKCRFYQADTLIVKVKVEPPDNSKPVLDVINTNPQILFKDNKQTLVAGQQISLALVANDADNIPKPDDITIDMIDARGSVEPVGYIFAPAQGSGHAQTTFTWNTDCSLFQNQVYENTYTFSFRTKDNRCFNPKADTVTVDFVIRDKDSKEADFIPPNIITPNHDSYNEFFAMVRENKDTGELESILPIDNCVGRFVSIVIYNRWGKEVFQSPDRNFRWYPDGEAAGVYFYTLKYSDREYKGSVTLRD